MITLTAGVKSIMCKHMLRMNVLLATFNPYFWRCLNAKKLSGIFVQMVRVTFATLATLQIISQPTDKD